VAFRELALKIHPDVNNGAAASEEFHRLHRAYKSLLEVRGGVALFTRRAACAPRAHTPSLRQHPEPTATWVAAPSASFRGAAARATRMRSTLLMCGATFVAGVGVFGGALLMHTRFDLYGANRYVAPDRTHGAALRVAVARRRFGQLADDSER
jgi:hypothetical protein